MAFFRDPGEMFLGCLGTVEQRYLVNLIKNAAKNGYTRFVEPCAGTFAIRKEVYELFLRAEHRFKESGQGEQKLKWVVQQARGLLPKWLQVIMSEEVLLKIIDWWFKEVKDLLDDGKVNGSQN